MTLNLNNNIKIDVSKINLETAEFCQKQLIDYFTEHFLGKTYYYVNEISVNTDLSLGYDAYGDHENFSYSIGKVAIGKIENFPELLYRPVWGVNEDGTYINSFTLNFDSIKLENLRIHNKVLTPANSNGFTQLELEKSFEYFSEAISKRFALNHVRFLKMKRINDLKSELEDIKEKENKISSWLKYLSELD